MELFGVLGRNPGLPTGWAGAPLLSWNIARWVQDSPICTGSCHSSTLEVTTVRSRETPREGLGRGGEPEEPERSPSAAVLRRRGTHTTSRAACAGPQRRHMCLTLGPRAAAHTGQTSVSESTCQQGNAQMSGRLHCTGPDHVLESQAAWLAFRGPWVKMAGLPQPTEQPIQQETWGRWPVPPNFRQQQRSFCTSSTPRTQLCRGQCQSFPPSSCGNQSP